MVKARKLAYHEETMKLLGERDNAGNSGRCTQARKATHGLDGQHQDLDRTLRGRVNQNGRGQRKYVHGVVNTRIDDGSLGGGASGKIGSRPDGK